MSDPIFPTRFVELDAAKLLGPEGREQFADAMLDLVGQLESDHCATKDGWSSGQIAVTFTVERNKGLAALHANWKITTKSPKRTSSRTTLRMVKGLVLVEEDNPDLEQMMLPGAARKERELAKAKAEVDRLQAELAHAQAADKPVSLPAPADDAPVALDVDPETDGDADNVLSMPKAAPQA